MEDILKKLEIARKNLEILNKISPSNPNSSSVKTQSLDNENKINIKISSENLSQLSSLSGSADLQQIKISENKIPESWSPQLNTPPEPSTNLFVQPQNINIQNSNVQTSYKELNVQSSEENLDNLAALSGTYEFQTLQIVGNTIPQSWCPEVVSTTSTGSGLLSDLVIDVDPVQKFGLGNMSLQNSDDVNITGGKISVDGFFNTGLILSNNSFSTGEISIRSPLINFKNISNTNVFIVPTGYIFLINTMEIITLEIESLIKSPKVSFGNTNSQNEYCGPVVSQSNNIGSRHIIKSPQNGIQENTIITINVLESSDSNVHNGFGIIRGSLIKTN